MTDVLTTEPDLDGPFESSTYTHPAYVFDEDCGEFVNESGAEDYRDPGQIL